MRLSLVAVVAVVVAGCTQTLPQAEFVERADAICAELNDEIDRIGRRGSADDFSTMIGSAEESAQLRREAIAAIRDLGEPEEGAETLEAMLEAMEESATKAQASIETLSEGDPTGAVAMIEESAEAGAKARELAEDFGFQECGQ